MTVRMNVFFGCVALWAGGACAGEPSACDVDLLGAIGGVQAIAVTGDRVVVARNGGAIEVYEQGIDDAWVMLGRNEDLMMDGARNSTGELSVSGALGLLTTSAGSGVLFDVSDANAPTVLGEIDYSDAPETYIDDVWVDGDTAVIAGRSWFRTYDIANPMDPVLLAHRSLSDIHWMEVRQGVLCTRKSSAFVTIWDLANPADPIATTTLSGYSCSYDNGKLAVGTADADSAAIELYDASNLQSLQLIGSLEVDVHDGIAAMHRMSLRGDRLITTSRDTMFEYLYGRMYDVSDPGSITFRHGGWALFWPYMVERYQTEAVFDELHEVGDDLLFVSHGQVWAYNDPAADFTMSHAIGKRALLPLAEADGGLLVWDRGRILWGDNTGIDAYSGSIVADVFEVLPEVDQYFVRSIDPGDGYVYVAIADPHTASLDQIRVYSIDLRTPSGATVVDSLVVWNAMFVDMAYWGGTLYLADFSSDEFRMIQTTPSGGLIDPGVTVSVPRIAYAQDRLFSTQGALGLASSGGGSGRSLDLVVFDLSDPLSPSPASQIIDADIEAPCVSVGDFMFCNIADSDAYGIFDLSDPASPVNRTGAGVALPAGAQLLCEKDGVLHFMAGSQVLFVDVNDPDDHRLVRIGSLNPAGAGAIAAPSEYGDGELAVVLGASLFRSNMITEDVIQLDLTECARMCEADLNGDGAVDFFDVSVFLGDRVDFNGDGSFDFFDVSAFLAAFNAGCP